MKSIVEFKYGHEKLAVDATKVVAIRSGAFIPTSNSSKGTMIYLVADSEGFVVDEEYNEVKRKLLESR